MLSGVFYEICSGRWMEEFEMIPLVIWMSTCSRSKSWWSYFQILKKMLVLAASMYFTVCGARTWFVYSRTGPTKAL